MGLEGLVDRRAGRSDADEQVGRLRAFRLARGTADLRHPRIPRALRGRGVLPRHAPKRAACRAARAVRTLDPPCLAWSWIRAASTSAAPSNSTTAPAPCATRWRRMVRAWHAALERAIGNGHRSWANCATDTDPTQMLFEVHGLILALHHDARFLRMPGALDRAHRFAGFALPRRRPDGRIYGPSGWPSGQCCRRPRRDSSADHRTAQQRSPGFDRAPAKAAPPRGSRRLTVSIFSLQGEHQPWPSTPRRCATCSFVLHEVFKVSDELKRLLPRHADDRRRHHQCGARRGRQVRRRR